MTRRLLLSLCAIGVLSGFVVTPGRVGSSNRSTSTWVPSIPQGTQTDLDRSRR